MAVSIGLPAIQFGRRCCRFTCNEVCGFGAVEKSSFRVRTPVPMAVGAAPLADTWLTALDWLSGVSLSGFT